MKLLPNRKSNVEYIDSVARLYKKRWLVFTICIVSAAVLFSGVCFAAKELDRGALSLCEAMKAKETFSIEEHNEDMRQLQYYLGARIGYYLSGVICFSIFLLVFALNTVLNCRKDRLLIDLQRKVTQLEGGLHKSDH